MKKVFSMQAINICVTGANGFIGRALLNMLIDRGCSVRVLTRNVNSTFPKGVEVIFGDLSSLDFSLDSFVSGCDVFFNCAGEIHNELAMYSLHVEATKRLLVAVSKSTVITGKKIHWVQLSSVGAYGRIHSSQDKVQIVTEDTPLAPLGTYEVTKTIADKLITDATNKGLITSCILRPSNVFGGNMPNQSLFNMVSVIDRGLFFYIGKPGAVVNYTHVNNVASALIECGFNELAKNKVFNVSCNCSIETFVNAIVTELNRSAPKMRVPKLIASFISNTLGNIPKFPLTRTRVDALINTTIYSQDKIESELGFNKVTSIEDGLKELVRVYKLGPKVDRM